MDAGLCDESITGADRAAPPGRLKFEVVAAREWPLIRPPKPWTSEDLARRLGTTASAGNRWRQGVLQRTLEAGPDAGEGGAPYVVLTSMPVPEEER